MPQQNAIQPRHQPGQHHTGDGDQLQHRIDVGRAASPNPFTCDPPLLMVTSKQVFRDTHIARA